MLEREGDLGDASLDLMLEALVDRAYLSLGSPPIGRGEVIAVCEACGLNGNGGG